MSCLAPADDQKKGAEQLINPTSQPYSERAARLNRFERLGHPEKASGVIECASRIISTKSWAGGRLAVDLGSGRIVEWFSPRADFSGWRERPRGASSSFACDFANN